MFVYIFCFLETVAIPNSHTGLCSGFTNIIFFSTVFYAQEKSWPSLERGQWSNDASGPEPKRLRSDNTLKSSHILPPRCIICKWNGKLMVGTKESVTRLFRYVWHVLSLCSLKLCASHLHSWLLHSLGLCALCSHSRLFRYLGLRTSHLHQRSQKAWPSTIIIMKLKKKLSMRGIEPACRAPISFYVQRLNHSATETALRIAFFS